MNEFQEKLKLNTYYIIIGIVSLFSVCFLPMLGSEAEASLNYPDTAVGIVVWWTTKTIVAILNVLIFHSFMQQARINVRNDEKYKQANEMLSNVRQKIYNPRSPKKFNVEQYGKKGTTIFISTGLATIALTQAILTFDYVSMLTYLFTIIMGIIFGILQMKKTELYWTEEFYDYVMIIFKKENKDAN